VEIENVKNAIKYVAIAAALTTLAHAGPAADAVEDAVTGISTDAGLGVVAGLTIGAVIFGARVVWGAVKSMAH